VTAKRILLPKMGKNPKERPVFVYGRIPAERV
jgi:hypothetical protein